MKTKFPSYEYKGFKYVPDEEIEYDSDGIPENRKIYHWVEPPSKELRDFQFDWCPYSIPTFKQFKLWIDLGTPGRINGGPLNAEDLHKILEMSE